MSNNTKSCFLCGIGGSGMSALARLLLAKGWIVSGSDRSHDRGETPDKFAAMITQGIKIYPQDGSGITDDIDVLIVSTAVEDTIPDVKTAKDKGIEIKHRAVALAELFNAAPLSIGVAGTSGKSTVTAMIGWICEQSGLQPTIINGALMSNFDGTNAVIGHEKSDIFIAEIDESDGSIVNFKPSIGLVNNISLDHKSMAELKELFEGFVEASDRAITNGDDNNSSYLQDKATAQFSLGHDEPSLILSQPGRHNRANAIAAITVAELAGVPREKAIEALLSYKGISRRFEILGVTEKNITVIDDFAHNPDKIAATLQTVQDIKAEKGGRVLAIFQPHGFGPTNMMRTELVDALSQGLDDDDMLIMPEIYYAGGTANKVISAADIVNAVKATGRQGHFFKTRPEIIPFIADSAQENDIIITMGARDDTLPQFGRDVLGAAD